jgi:CheY-like chemotaxis protein
MMNKTPEKILLIDDDTDDQLFFQEVMDELNPEIHCKVADNGLSGLELLKNGYLPNLIFLDLNMPYMNGFDFLARFKEVPDWEKIPVVIFTTSNQQRDIERSKELGANAYLTKPNNVETLRQDLMSILSWDFSPSLLQLKVF